MSHSSPALGALQAAVVLQGQKRADGQWYLLHYDGAPEGHCWAASLLEACSRPPRFCWPLLCNHRASLLPSLCPGWSNKYNEWVEESGLVRWDKTLLEQSAAAAGNPPGDLAGRKVGLGRWLAWLGAIGVVGRAYSLPGLQPALRAPTACQWGSSLEDGSARRKDWYRPKT